MTATGGTTPDGAARLDAPGALLVADVDAVREARGHVREICTQAGLSRDRCADAVLLASEVVTNALTHGRSDARVVVRPVPTGLRVEVSDDNSRHPQAAPEDVDALDGRGMAILKRLSTTWGVRDDPFGKTVWFEVSS